MLLETLVFSGIFCFSDPLGLPDPQGIESGTAALAAPGMSNVIPLRSRDRRLPPIFPCAQ
jgi:hypothetical protein